MKLKELGLAHCVDEIDAQKVYGYAMYKDDGEALVGYPLEGEGDDVAGRSFHNGRFVMRLREAAMGLREVDCRQATVKKLLSTSGAEWREGDVVLGSWDARSGPNLAARDVVFGVVRSYVGKGGGGAVFLGLAKRRLPRIRPTLLEQTDVASLRFDFVRRRMELSRTPLIPRGAPALELLDLRRRGSPVESPTVRVSRLVVNGEEVATSRPLVAVIDTGTTGISVSGRAPHPLHADPQPGSCLAERGAATARPWAVAQSVSDMHVGLTDPSALRAPCAR